MAEYLSPGVYVEEYDDSPRSIEGVGTSTAGFIGMAVKGPTIGAPMLVTNFADFQRQYGGFLSEYTHGAYRFLAYSVEQFFANGGTRCFIARVIPDDAKKAAASKGILGVEAVDEGRWGNRIMVSLSTVNRKKMQLVEKKGERIYVAKSVAGFREGDIVKFGEEMNRISNIFEETVTFEEEFEADPVDVAIVPKSIIYSVEMDVLVRYNEDVESFQGITLNTASPNYIVKRLSSSNIIKVTAELDDAIMSPVETILGEGTLDGVISLCGGADGTEAKINAGTFIGRDGGPGKRTGLASFIENNNVSMMAIPGVTIPEVIVALVGHCENTRSRFAVIDIPQELYKTSDLIEYRNMIDSTYAAMYHPWIKIFDRSTQKPGFIPPSGAVMGVYARTDTSRGVHKAPANEPIFCSGLSVNYNTGEQDILNPQGINLIRSLPGQGIRIWGARTASSNSAFKYINVRRLFIYVEESIKANTNWVVFEPNNATLWSRVQMTVGSFLDSLWRSGMLSGASAAESYFVEIGPTTMSQDDIMNGRLICKVGIAPSRPAEFVIFRVTQFTAESGGGGEE